MKNGGLTLLGVLVWTILAGFYWASGLLSEPLGSPWMSPILWSALVAWLCLRLPTLFWIRAVILGTGILVVWYSFGLVPGL